MCDYLKFEASGLISGTPEYWFKHKKYITDEPIPCTAINPVTNLPYRESERLLSAGKESYV